jgi:Lrp/AsnC family transcriptional regulator, leucine-responsive regulatory protein
MLDAIDRTLLALLKEDTRRKYTELGEAVHLSSPSVHARVRKLEQLGAIQKYTIELNPGLLGLTTCAFIRIIISKATCPEVVEQLQKLKEIEECHSVAGEDCLILKVRTATPADLEPLINYILKVPGVERTVTSIVLTSYFERGITVR